MALSVLGLDEAELKQPLADELPRRPAERLDVARVAGSDIGDHRFGRRARSARGVQPDIRERARIGDAKRSPLLASAGGLVESRVRTIDMQHVLILDVEDKRTSVGRIRSEPFSPLGSLEQHVQEKQGVRRLRRDAGDARDRDVAALLPVEEGEVRVDWPARLIHSDCELLLHLVHEQRQLPVQGSCSVHRSSRRRRDPELRVRPQNLNFDGRDVMPGIVFAWVMR